MWNDYENNNNQFSQFSGHQTSRPSSTFNSNSGSSSNSNGNSRDVYNVPDRNRDTYNQNSGNSNNGREIYNSNPGNSNNQNSFNTQKPTTKTTQGRDVYNQDRDFYQPKETSTSRYEFIADSLANSENSKNNYNPSVTQRPTIQRTTTTTEYDYGVYRRTTSPNRETNVGGTTRKSTYFQGDLPFLNNDRTETTVNFKENKTFKRFHLKVANILP